MGRTGEASFTVISAGISSQQALAFARRLHEQLDKAQITYANQLLRIGSSIGLAALDVDTTTSIEELMKLALQRLQASASRKSQPVTPQTETGPARVPALPGEIERAVQVIEHASADQLGDAAGELLRRLLPFLQAACKRLNVDLPLDKIAQALKNRKK